MSTGVPSGQDSVPFAVPSCPHASGRCWYTGRVRCRHLPARRARYGRLNQPLSPALEATLRGVGAKRLYTHQAQAINAVQAGQHVILCTGTASGKTLAYNIPVLETLIADPQACALYLFPIRALAQDWLRSLRELAGSAATVAGMCPLRSNATDRRLLGDHRQPGRAPAPPGRCRACGRGRRRRALRCSRFRAVKSAFRGSGQDRAA